VRMGEDSRVHRVLVGKPEEKRPLGRPRRSVISLGAGGKIVSRPSGGLVDGSVWTFKK
jgi:hypothetical protein